MEPEQEHEQERKYFGMTGQQLAILAGLGVGACLLFGVAGMLFLRGGTSVFGGMPEGTSIPQSTSTPFMLPTVAASQTPTPIPYETLVPAGWTQFKTALVEIWLPNGFEQADPQKVADPGNLGTRDLVMTAILSEASSKPVLVMVFYKPLTAVSLDAQLDSDLAKTPGNIRQTDRRKAPEISPEAIRIVQETGSGTDQVNQMTYVFLDGSTIWFVQYTAQINEFFEMTDEFERSARTFRIVR